MAKRCQLVLLSVRSSQCADYHSAGCWNGLDYGCKCDWRLLVCISWRIIRIYSDDFFLPGRFVRLISTTAWPATYRTPRHLWWWHTVKKLVQETWPSDMVSCTRFFLYMFLAPNTAQLYSIQETCMHVTRMVSSDWSAAYRCHVLTLSCWCWQFVVQS